MTTIDLDAAFARITTYWDPHVAGELNGQMVKLAKFQGEFIRHHHENEDELFLVHKGEIHLRFGDSVQVVKAGQFIVVPRGVEHQPYAPGIAEVVLFEPAATRNTGNITNEHTRDTLKRADNITEWKLP